MKLILCIGVLSILSACGSDPNGKKSEGMYNDGRCTQATVSAFNDVARAHYSVSTLNSACSRFQSLMGGSSCRLEVNFVETTISSNYFGSRCEAPSNPKPVEMKPIETKPIETKPAPSEPVKNTKPGINKDGSCNDLTVFNFENYYVALKSFSKTASSYDLVKLQNSCADARYLLGDESCYIINPKDNSKISISYGTHYKEVCTAVEKE